MSGVARTNRPGGTAQATRQQLDELDALLQRMLDLPVSQAEEPDPIDHAPPPPRPPEPARPTTPRPAARRAYPPSYMVVETSSPPLADGPSGLGPRKVEREPEPPPEAFEPYRTAEPAAEAEPTGDWVPLRTAWQPSEQTWKPLAESWEQSRGAPPVIPPEPPRVWLPPQEPTAPPVVIPPPAPHTVGQPVIPPPPSAMPRPEPGPSTPLVLLPAVWFNKAFDVCLLPLGPVGRWLQGRAGFLGALGLLALVAAAALAAADGCGWTR